MKIENKIFKDICDSYHSTKCVGRGNGRKGSIITARCRRQTNKRRRQRLQKLDKASLTE